MPQSVCRTFLHGRNSPGVNVAGAGCGRASTLIVQGALGRVEHLLFVGHAALLSSLQQLQISTGWLQDYLSGHTQRVRVGNTLSDPHIIDIGTFQGSCLGPLLYNIVSNSISCYIPSQINDFQAFSVRYADDSQVGVTGSREKLPELKAALECILDTLGTWFLQHGMKINAGKTEVILCGDQRQLTNYRRPPKNSVHGTITLSFQNG